MAIWLLILAWIALLIFHWSGTQKGGWAIGFLDVTDNKFSWANQMYLTRRKTEKKVNGQPKTTCRLRKSCGEIVWGYRTFRFWLWKIWAFEYLSFPVNLDAGILRPDFWTCDLEDKKGRFKAPKVAGVI